MADARSSARGNTSARQRKKSTSSWSKTMTKAGIISSLAGPTVVVGLRYTRRVMDAFAPALMNCSSNVRQAGEDANGGGHARPKALRDDLKQQEIVVKLEQEFMAKIKLAQQQLEEGELQEIENGAEKNKYSNLAAAVHRAADHVEVYGAAVGALVENVEMDCDADGDVLFARSSIRNYP